MLCCQMLCPVLCPYPVLSGELCAYLVVSGGGAAGQLDGAHVRVAVVGLRRPRRQAGRLPRAAHPTRLYTVLVRLPLALRAPVPLPDTNTNTRCDKHRRSRRTQTQIPGGVRVLQLLMLLSSGAAKTPVLLPNTDTNAGRGVPRTTPAILPGYLPDLPFWTSRRENGSACGVWAEVNPNDSPVSILGFQ